MSVYLNNIVGDILYRTYTSAHGWSDGAMNGGHTTVWEDGALVEAIQMRFNGFEEGTGAGVIFGTTGGVMEAALRSAYFFLKGENAAADAFQAVRAEGFNANHGVQEAEFQIDDITVRARSQPVRRNRERRHRRLNLPHREILKVLLKLKPC